MPEANRMEPEPSQIVSDLGQLTVFSDPLKMRIIRILQQQETTTERLVEITGEPRETISRQILALSDVKLIRVVGQQGRGRAKEDLYRATARVYNLRPEPGESETISASVASSTLDAVTKEIVASLMAWPNQKMNYEGRRTRMSYERAAEFNEKLVDLITEYWGSPDVSVEEDPDDPLLALIGAWYRIAEET